MHRLIDTLKREFDRDPAYPFVMGAFSLVMIGAALAVLASLAVSIAGAIKELL